MGWPAGGSPTTRASHTNATPDRPIRVHTTAIGRDPESRSLCRSRSGSTSTPRTQISTDPQSWPRSTDRSFFNGTVSI